VLIIGAYGDSLLEESGSDRGLVALERFLAEFLDDLPVALHLLPPFQNSGDDGFVQDTWYMVDPRFGTNEDLRSLAASRFLFLDGVYNHVGIGHELAQALVREPSVHRDNFYVTKHEPNNLGWSPRGGNAVRVMQTHDGQCFAWQTFSPDVIDLNLWSATVRAAVIEHLEFYVDVGVGGVRLDAVSYLGKPHAAESNLHHERGKELTRWLVHQVRSAGMRPWAQLDCDPRGLSYDLDGCIQLDYSYSAYLLLAVMNWSPDAFVGHIARTREFDGMLLRAPRTHDGILLRSPLLLDEDCSLLLERAGAAGYTPTVTDGRPYDLSCTLPEIVATEADPSGFSRLELAIVLTLFCSNFPYFYLPALMGEQGIPVELAKDRPARWRNRRPISSAAIAAFAASEYRAVIRDLFSIADNYGLNGEPAGSLRLTVDMVSTSVVRVVRHDARLTVLVNVDDQRSWSMSDHHGDIVYMRRAEAGKVGPCGFVILANDP